MRRLYQGVYLAVIASLVAVVVIAGLFLRFGLSMPPMNQNLELAADFVARALVKYARLHFRLLNAATDEKETA